MKSIIIAVPSNEQNPLIKQYYSSLIETNKYKVYWGLDFFWEQNFVADIIWIHWPESLFMWQKISKENLDKTHNIITNIKKKSKLIATVHNTTPHNHTSKYSKKLYQLIYENADLILHFGKASLNFIQAAFPNSKKHAIVPHPIYDSLPKEINKAQTRNKLNIANKNFIILSVGKIRSKSEFLLLLKGFNKAKIPNKKLVIAGGKIDFKDNKLQRLLLYIKKKIYAPNLLLINRSLSEQEVAEYPYISDCMVIPRINSLNSGNLYLAFTYAKPVAAPDIGVIGEVARATNNPVFNPNDFLTLSKALEFTYSNKPETNYSNSPEVLTTNDVIKIISQLIEALFKTN